MTEKIITKEVKKYITPSMFKDSVPVNIEMVDMIFDEWVEKTKGDCDDFYGTTKGFFKKTEQLTRKECEEEIQFKEDRISELIVERDTGEWRKKLIEKIEKLSEKETRDLTEIDDYFHIARDKWENLKKDSEKGMSETKTKRR